MPFTPIGNDRLVGDFSTVPTTPPNQLRWDPLPMGDAPVDFVDSLITMAGNGSVASMSGCAIHLYAATATMRDRFFYSSDGELLIVPQEGRLMIATELGVIELEPFEIAVIPLRVPFPLPFPTGPPPLNLSENLQP